MLGEISRTAELVKMAGKLFPKIICGDLNKIFAFTNMGMGGVKKKKKTGLQPATRDIGDILASPLYPC